MKSILITAAVLMTGASVYGIVDYNKKATTTEFKNLYREEKPEAKNETPMGSREIVPAKIEVTKEKPDLVVEKSATEKPAKKSRKFRLSEFSRARLVPAKS